MSRTLLHGDDRTVGQDENFSVHLVVELADGQHDQHLGGAINDQALYYDLSYEVDAGGALTVWSQVSDRTTGPQQYRVKHVATYGPGWWRTASGRARFLGLNPPTPVKHFG
jgi:hypothetical protein